MQKVTRDDCDDVINLRVNEEQKGSVERLGLHEEDTEIPAVLKT